MDEMNFLQPGKWLGNNIIDQYLLQNWLKVKNTSPVLYIGTYIVRACRRDALTEEECVAMRKILLLPESDAIPIQPVAGVVHDANLKHFFVIVLDHKRLHVAVLGRLYNRDLAQVDQKPEKWGGMKIWRHVCKLFRWPIPLQRPTWWAVDWKQVSSQELVYCMLTLFNNLHCKEWYRLWRNCHWARGHNSSQRA